MSQKKKAYDIRIEASDDAMAEAQLAEAAAEAAAAVEPEPDPAPAEPGAAEILDQLQRLQAEFTNYRRRVDRERGETVVWAQGQLVERMLPVLDALDRAAESIRDDGSPAAKGLLMVRDKFVRSLEDAGLERIRAVGEPFDPSLHEALLTQPVDADQAGKVLMEVEPGYYFKSRLVRPARVQVGVENES